MPNQTTSGSQEKISALILKAKSKTLLAPLELFENLDILESYECWVPFFKLIERHIPSCEKRDDKLALYKSYIRAQNLHCRRQKDAISMCRKMISDLKMTFKEFSINIQPEILDPTDPYGEATFIKSIYKAFPNKKDRVASLENLCLVYHKKFHDEKSLAGTYDLILSIDKTNIKALKYFKVYYTQSESWESVVTVLEQLLRIAKNDDEKFRVALELAGIYLYQLQAPKKTLNILDKFCTSSSLDTNTLKYDSYLQLREWDKCLRLLDQALSEVSEDHMRASLYFRIGQIYKFKGNLEQAYKSHIKSSKFWPQLLEPIEEIAHMQVEQKNWHDLHITLEKLVHLVQGEDQQLKLKSLKDVLESCLKHVDQK